MGLIIFILFSAVACVSAKDVDASNKTNIVSAENSIKDASVEVDTNQSTNTNNNSLKINDDSKLKKSSDTKDNLGTDDDSGSFSDLYDLINSATVSTIYLNKNYEYKSDSDIDYIDGIVINKEITINGRGHNITINGANYVFYVNHTGVVLNSMNITSDEIYWNVDTGSFTQLNTLISNAVTVVTLDKNYEYRGNIIDENYTDGVNVPDTITSIENGTYYSIYGNGIDCILIINGEDTLLNFITDDYIEYADGISASFSELATLINSSYQTTITLNKNYKYRGLIDKNYESNGIVIDDAITINGNGYTIDANDIANHALYVNHVGVVINKELTLSNIKDGNDAIVWNVTTGSFTELYELITNPSDSGVVTLTKSYAYRGTLIDELYADGITVPSTVSTIDGESYNIDGNGLTSILTVNSDDTILNFITDDIITYSSGNGSFSDLARLISYAGSILTLTTDYIYRGTIDKDYKSNGVVINKSLTINGNSRIINGNNLASHALTVTDVNTVINKELTFSNMLNSGAGVVWNNGASSFTDFAALFSSSPTTVTLSKNYAYRGTLTETVTDAVTISSAVTVNGANYYVYGNGLNPIINVYNDNVILNFKTTDKINFHTSSGSYSDLTKLIKLTPVGSTLILYADYKYRGTAVDGDHASEGINFNKQITIDGNGYAVDGNSLCRGFSVTVDNAILKNINIKNCKISTYGACIYWTGANGQLINANISNGQTTTGGNGYSGGISWWGDNGTLIHTDVYNCRSVQSDYRNALAITILATVKWYNSTFHDVTSQITTASYGWLDIVGASQNSYFYGCNFTNIYLKSTYGAVFIEASTATFEKCNFINKLNPTSKSGKTTYYSAGLIFDKCPVDFIDCYFEHNKNANYGMFHCLQDNTFTNCTFNTFNRFVSESQRSFDSFFTDCRFMNGNQVFNSKYVDTEFGNRYSFDSFVNCNFTSCKNIFASINYNSVLGGTLFLENCIFNKTTGGANNAVISLTSGLKHVIRNCTFIDSSTTYDIYIASGVTSLLENNNHTSSSRVSNKGGSFVYATELWVSPTGNGNGSEGNESSLSYAFNNIFKDGVVHIANGTYTLDKAYAVNFVIDADKNVIFKNYGLTLMKGYSVSGLIFDSLIDSIRMNTFSHISNCTFENSQTSTIFEVIYQTNISNCNFIECTVNYVVSSHSHGLPANTIEFCDIVNSTIKTAFLNVAKGFVYSTYRNITFTNSSIKTFNYIKSDSGVFVDTKNVKYINISFIDCNLTDTVLVTYTDTVEDIAFENIKIINCNYLGSNALIKINDNVVFSGLNISNLKNSNNADIINIGGEGCNVSNIVLTNLNSTNLIKSSYSYILHDFVVRNVNAYTAMNTFSNMNLYNLHFSNTNFTSNYITFLNGNTVLSNSSFTDFTGHIVINGSAVKIVGSSFIRGNNSALNGSALEVLSSGSYLNIRDCNFTSNTGYYGGAIYIHDGVGRPTFYQVNFTDNTATGPELDQYYEYLGNNSMGGAIKFEFVLGKGVVMTIDEFTEKTINNNSRYYNNIAGNITSLVGDYVYVVLDPVAWGGSGSARTRADAGTFETAFLLAGDGCTIVFVKEGEIFDYSTLYDGARAGVLMPDFIPGFVMSDNLIFLGNNTVIKNLRFHVPDYITGLTAYNITYCGNENTSVVIDGNNVLFEDCNFEDNGGDIVAYGAAVQINGDNVTFINCTFNNNNALNTNDIGINGFGGALYINSSNILIENCTFKDNTASNTGSHIFVVEGHTEITIKSSNFINAEKYDEIGDCAGVVITGANVNIYNCSFSGNDGNIGSALFIMGDVARLNVYNNNFINNNADKGVVYVNITPKLNTLISIYDNNFVNNNALYGGALFVEYTNYPKLLIIEGNNYTSNNASYGGAVFINCDSVNLMDSVFKANNASYGGAVFINASGSVISNCNFTLNIAKRGGALYLNGTNIIVRNSNFTYNNASEYGSAIFYATLSEARLYNVNVYENHIYGEFEGGRGDIALARGSEYGAEGLTLGYWTGTPSYKNYVTSITEEYWLSVIYVNMTGTGGGFDVDSATNIDNAFDHLKTENSKIIFTENMDLNKLNLTRFTNLTITTLPGVSIRRNSSDNSKYLFIIDNSTVIFENMILEAGVNVTNGSTFVMDNVTFTSNDAVNGGILYESGTDGNIIDSTFINTTALDGDYILNIYSNVNISGSNFTNNTVKAINYAGDASGIIYNNYFDNNFDATAGDRNIHVGDSASVNITANSFDTKAYIVVNGYTLPDKSIYFILNFTYGYAPNLNITLNSGVYMNIYNVTIDIKGVNGTVFEYVLVCDTTREGYFNLPIVAGFCPTGVFNITIHNKDIHDNIFRLITPQFINNIGSQMQFIINKDLTNLTVSVSNKTYDSKVNFTGLVNSIGTGNSALLYYFDSTASVNVTVYDESKENIIYTQNYTITQLLATGGLQLPVLAAGDYILNMTFDGNRNYTGNTSEMKFRVDKASSIVKADLKDYEFSYGQNITINISSVNATSVVWYIYNGTVIMDNGTFTGNSTIKVKVLPVGNYTLNLTTVVDGNHSVCINNSATLNITKANVLINDIGNVTVDYGTAADALINILGNITNGIVYGNNYTDQIIVSIIGYEYINFTTSLNNSGVYSGNLNISSLNAGLYSLNITIIGNQNYTRVNKTFVNYLNITKTPVNVYFNGAVVYYGVDDNLTINGTVTYTHNYGVEYENNITIIIGNRTYNNIAIKDNKFTITIGDIELYKAGLYNVTIIESDNNVNYYLNASTTSLVNNISVNKSVVNVSFNGAVITYGMQDYIVVNGTVSNTTYGVGYNGIITIKIGNKTYNNINVSNGKFSVNITDIEDYNAGIYNVSISESVLNDNYTFVNTTFKDNITVNLASSNVTIYVSDIFVDNKPVFHIIIGGNEYGVSPNGNITINVNGTSINYNFTSLDFNYTDWDSISIFGNYNLSVIYNGNENYTKSNASATFKVKKYQTDVVVSTNSTVYKVDDLVNIFVKVLNIDNSTVIPEGNVTYTITGDNGYTVILNTSAMNSSSIKINREGVYVVSAMYNVNYKFESCVNSTSFTVEKYTPDISLVVEPIMVDETAYIIVKVNSTAGSTIPTGNITVLSSYGVYEFTLDENGCYNYSVVYSSATDGNVTFTAIYSGDYKYNNVSASVNNFTVSKYDTSVIITHTGNSTLDNITVYVQLNSTVLANISTNSNITVSLYNYTLTKSIDDTGYAVFNFGRVPYNNTNYPINLVFSGNYKFKGITSVDWLAIGKVGTNTNYTFDVDVNNVKVGENVTINVKVIGDERQTPEGVIYFNVYGHNVTIKELVNGSASLVLDNLKAQTYSITISYGGDEFYNASSTNTNFTVSKWDSYTNVLVDNINCGDNASITVSVTSDGGVVNGTVVVRVNNQNHNVTLINGNGILKIPDLSYGSYSVIATYMVSDKFYESTNNSQVFNVYRYNSNVLINIGEVHVGENCVVNFTVSGYNTYGFIPSSNLTITFNGKTQNITLTDGKCSLNISGLSATSYPIYAYYNGDSNFNSSDNNMIFDVVKNTTSVNVTIGSYKVGEHIFINITVNPTGVGVIPTGNVSFIGLDNVKHVITLVNGSALYDMGIAQYNMTGTSIVVNYEGDDNYISSQGLDTLLVEKWIANLEMHVEDIDYGSYPVVYANITSEGGLINGSVNFTFNGKQYVINIIQGKGNLTITDLLNAGKYNFTAVYGGDDKFMNIEYYCNFTVNKAPVTINVTGVNVDYGEKVIVNVTANAAGIYNITVNNITRNIEITSPNEIVSLDLGIFNTNLNGYQIIVFCNETDNYLSARNDTEYVYVNKIKSNIIVIVDDVKIDQNPCVNITLPDNVTGIVNVTVNDEKYIINLSSERSLILPILPVGKYNVNVFYAGDINYMSSNASGTFNVFKYNATDLQKLIDEAISNNQTHIILEHDYEYGENESVPVKIYESIVIDGNGHTIDAGNTSGIFNISANGIVLGNMTLTGSNGTGIITSGNQTILSNISLVNNTGTAIVVNGADAILDGVVVCNNNGVGVIINAENVTVANSTFVNNTGISGSSIISNANNTIIKNSLFENNSVSGVGGAVVLNGDNAVVDNSSFINNSAKSGGAMYVNAEPVNITNSIFKNNTAKDCSVNNLISKYVNDPVLSNVSYNGPVITRENDYLSASASNGIEGEVSVVVNVKTETINGTVSLTIDGKTYSGNVVNGSGTIIISDLARGTYKNVVINYECNGYYLDVNTTVSFVVNPPRANIIHSNAVVDYGSNYKYLIRIIGVDAKPVGSGVVVNVNGKNYITNSKGYITIVLDKSYVPGIYKIKLSYKGVTSTKTIRINKVLKIKASKSISKSAVFTAVLKASKANKVVNKKAYAKKSAVKNTIIRVKLNGKVYKLKTNVKGIAKVYISKNKIKISIGSKFKSYSIKLKNNKKYAVKFSYGKDVVKRYVKIKG